MSKRLFVANFALCYNLFIYCIKRTQQQINKCFEIVQRNNWSKRYEASYCLIMTLQKTLIAEKKSNQVCWF